MTAPVLLDVTTTFPTELGTGNGPNARHLSKPGAGSTMFMIVAATSVGGAGSPHGLFLSHSPSGPPADPEAAEFGALNTIWSGELISHTYALHLGFFEDPGDELYLGISDAGILAPCVVGILGFDSYVSAGASGLIVPAGYDHVDPDVQYITTTITPFISDSLAYSCYGGSDGLEGASLLTGPAIGTNLLIDESQTLDGWWRGFFQEAGYSQAYRDYVLANGIDENWLSMIAYVTNTPVPVGGTSYPIMRIKPRDDNATSSRINAGFNGSTSMQTSNRVSKWNGYS